MRDVNVAGLPLANPGSIDSKFVNQVLGDIICYIIMIVSNVGFSDLTGGTIDDPLLAGRLVGPTESGYVDNVLNYHVNATNLGGYIDLHDVDGGDPTVVVVINVLRGADRTGNDFILVS